MSLIEAPIPLPIPGFPGPPIAAAGPIPLHALGESVAASAIAIQRELGRSRCESGGFVLDELDLTIPVRVRLDALGQILASVDDSPHLIAPAAGQLRLRIRFGSPCDAPEVSAPQPLTDLGLSPEDIAALEKYSLFTVDDLLRIGRNVFGLRAIEQIGTKSPAWTLVGRAMLLTIGVPSAVFGANVSTPEQFIAADAAAIAKAIKCSVDQVKGWQDRARTLIA